jgi:hypothetical protein
VSHSFAIFSLIIFYTVTSSHRMGCYVCCIALSGRSRKLFSRFPDGADHGE